MGRFFNGHGVLILDCLLSLYQVQKGAHKLQVKVSSQF